MKHISEINITTLRRAVFFGLALLLTGCAGLQGEKRHSPAEIAAYKPADFVAPIASAAGERAEYEAALAKIANGLAETVSIENTEQANDDAAVNALWAVGFLNTDRDAGRKILLKALSDLPQRSTDRQRAILSAAYALYPEEAAPYLKQMLDQYSTPRQFAIAAYAILKSDNVTVTRDAIRAVMQRQFPDWQNEPRLRALDHVLSADVTAELRGRPPLRDLLAAPIRPGYPVIFSFQRRDRMRFGMAMVRGPDGRFVRNADGSYFNIPQLAMALTNLPGTITNGNTPQGLFTIVGAGTATNKWIGPTPYLHAKVPIEGKVAEFEHAQLDGDWSEQRYESYFPATWRNYFPIKEALLAGQAGRDDMLAHGTTINPEYYRNAAYYPGTPSAGCLVAMEYWSKADGKLMHSDQLALAKAFTAGGIDRGYLVVVELDDRPAAVSMADVVGDVIRAEESAGSALR